MYVLVALQLAVLALFVVVAMGKAIGGDFPTATDFSMVLAEPVQRRVLLRLATALSLSIFMYWGWDCALSAAEETSGRDARPASRRCSRC